MAENRAQYEEALSRGHSFSWDQRWQEAIKAFEVAAAEFPDKPAPYAGMGMACVELGRLQEALEYYKTAARYSQGDVIYLRQVADVQERLGNSEAAGQTYMAIGEIHLRRGALEQAVDNWHRAVRVAPNLLGAHQRLARYHTQQGQVRAAVREYLAIARLYQARGEQEKALQTCRAALNLDPRNPDILTAIELVQHGETIFGNGSEAGVAQPDEGAVPFAGEAAEAGELGMDEYRPFGEGDDSPVQSTRRLALEQLAQELFADESEDSQDDEALFVDHDERNALVSRALDYQTRGLIDEAIQAYEEAMAAGLHSVAAHFNLGLLYQDKLRFGDAIRQFEMASEEEQYRLASHYALGESYRARGQIDRAVRHFVTALQMVDLGTVEVERAVRLDELYDNLLTGLLDRSEPEKATAFANGIVDLLNRKGWEQHVQQARARLDALSGERMMILGDILTAGSTRVLESLYLSQEYLRDNMPNTAVEEVYRAIAYSPDYLPSHIQLGEILVKQGRREAAVEKFAVVGKTFLMRGDAQNAVSMFERVVDVSPLDVSVRTGLIDLLQRQGAIDRALEHSLALGKAYYQLAQADKAREIYGKALDLAARSSGRSQWRRRLLRQIADIDMQRLDWKRALASYRELRREDPADEEAAKTMVSLYFRLRQPAYALHELDSYLKQLVAAGQSERIAAVLKDLIEQHPAQVGLSRRLVRLYMAQGRRDDAIKALDDLGEAQLEAGNTEEAAATLEQLVRLNPPNVASYRQLLKQLRGA